MSDRSIFNIISEIIQRKQIKCVLIGGFAVNSYNYGRQTGDIDFLITKDDFNKIAESLEKEGYSITSQENFAQLENLRFSLMDIDFMFVDDDTINKILKDTKKTIILGQSFLVPSLMHLIALKIHALKFNYRNRLMKDVPDIVSLLRINNIDPRGIESKEICLKYGNEQIYQKIMEVF